MKSWLLITFASALAVSAFSALSAQADPNGTAGGNRGTGASLPSESVAGWGDKGRFKGTAVDQGRSATTGYGTLNDPRFVVLDKNLNGVVDKDEFGRGSFDRYDVNGDGKLGIAEWTAFTNDM